MKLLRLPLLAAITLALSAQAAPAPIQPGMLVTYSFGGQDRYCGRVSLVYEGTAWLVDREHPAWIVRMPVRELQPGCRQA